MYIVYADGHLIHHPNLDDVQLVSPVVTLEAGKAGSFRFTMPRTHPRISDIEKLVTRVEVYRDSEKIFSGRVIDDSFDFRNNRAVMCEGYLALFNDSVIRPYSYEGTIEGYMQMLLDQHNAQVESWKQFQLGNVTVTDPNNFIVRADSAYPSTWSVLQAKLPGLLGGYLFARESGGQLYLDYLEDSPYTTGQKIELHTNLLDVQQERSAAEICTALIPLGARNEDTDERLTIDSVNGGLDYVHDAAAVDRYGWIFQTAIWDDVTLPENLLARANAYLANQILTEVTITVRAADLSMTELAVDDFRCFEHVKIESKPHDIDEYFLILSQTLNLVDPKQNVMTVGSVRRTLTETQLDRDTAIRDIKANYITNETVNGVRETIVAMQSLIEQTADAIRLEVSEAYTTVGALETVHQELATMLEQNALGWTFSFSELQTSLEELDGETRTKLETLDAHIRMEGGTITLGRSDSTMSTRITNDRLSFLDGGAEVAYITGQTMYIASAVIMELQLGNHIARRSDNDITNFFWAHG